MERLKNTPPIEGGGNWFDSGICNLKKAIVFDILFLYSPYLFLIFLGLYLNDITVAFYGIYVVSVSLIIWFLILLGIL